MMTNVQPSRDFSENAAEQWDQGTRIEKIVLQKQEKKEILSSSSAAAYCVVMAGGVG